MSRCRDEHLGIRLGIRQRILVSKQDLQDAIDETDRTGDATTPVGAKVTEFVRNGIGNGEIGPKSARRQGPAALWHLGAVDSGQIKKCHSRYGIPEIG